MHPSILPYLEAHLTAHPSMTAQDIAKLCYQAAHGAEHLLLNLDRARSYFMAEWEATAPDGSIPVSEPISDRVARVNLAAWKAAGRTPEDLFDRFAATATVSGEGDTLLQAYLAEISTYLQTQGVSVSYEDWTAFLSWYDSQGRPAVHHSEAYREAEKPAYRIVLRSLSESGTNPQK